MPGAWSAHGSGSRTPGPGRLHAVRAARPVSARQAAAAGGLGTGRGHRLHLRRPGTLRALPGRVRRRRLSQARHRLRAGAPVPRRRRRDPLRRAQPAARARPPPELPGRHRGRPPDRRAAGKPGAPPGRTQGRRPAAHPPGPGDSSLPGGRGARGSRGIRQRPDPPARRPARAMGPAPGVSGGVAAPPAGRAARRRVVGDGRRAPGRRDPRRLAGLQGVRVRRGDRRRFHHHRRPPVRLRQRRRAPFERDDESPDPLRRGPDEPGLPRHDDPKAATS